MNQKYNEYPAGTYDTDKIFLQADPVTGALEKVNLPAPAASPNFIRLFSTGVLTNATTNALTVIYSFTIPANTLTTNGDGFQMKLTGQSAQDDGYTEFKITIPGLTDSTFSNNPGDNIIYDIQFLRASGAGGALLFTSWHNEGAFAVIWNETFTLDATADIDILVEGLVETTGSIRGMSMTVDLIKM